MAPAVVPRTVAGMESALTPEDVVAAIGRRAGDAEVGSQIEVRETHVSWVFLAGDRAYKLKKPVVLPFLDYGTADQRRDMCRAEVRVNQRLAPDLYLGVCAISRGAEGLQLTKAEDPGAVDYLVEMRRYDERDTLAARLARGELGDGEITAVGQMLARFHDRARRVDGGRVPTLAIERRMTENVHQLLSVVEHPAEVGRVLALQRFVHVFVAAHAHTLDRRARRGRVREGHGDLRAEHVVLGGQLEIIDGIEFDPALRELDVGDDLAFLVMDLVAHHGQRWADALVRAYRDAGGDPGEDWLIAFYASYRALVRAKVALVRAGQYPVCTGEHGQASAAARELLRLAERFAWRARLPLVIVICGVPAAGKSHLARALAEVTGLPHISADVTRKRLAGLRPEQRAAAGAYSAAFTRLTYAELGRAAANQVAARGGALVDATFRHRVARDAFAEAFAGAAPVLYVECVVPMSVLAERAARRERQPERISDASLSVVLHERSTWEPLDEVEPEAHVMLRTDRTVQAQLDDLVALVDRRIGRVRAPEVPADQAPIPRIAQAKAL